MAGSPSLFINGVSITPGGFLALEGVFRNHFLPADIGSVYQSIPYYNSRVGYADEFRLSARQSRFSLLAKGDIDPVTHLAGYIEGDFLGAAQTANSNESNSYQPRIRHVYATFDQDDWGAHVLAGQNWSLITMNTKGIIPRQEDTPLTIDAQYVPGFAWARQPQLRFVKDFGKSLWVGVSVENPQTTAGCAPASGVFVNPCFPAGTPLYVGYLPTVGAAATYAGAPLYNSPAIGGSLFNTANSYSFNHVPDVAGKVAWDSSFDGHNIHVEGFGLFREFTDQTVNNPFFSGAVANNNVAGGSGGGSVLVSVLPKMLEAQFSGMTGRGVGRYGSGQLPDVTINWNGTLSPIQETMLLAGLIAHPTPQLDLYAYAGEEDQQASEATIITSPGHFSAYGYGNPLYTNAGCSIISSAACVGNTHLIRQITGGLWDNRLFGAIRKTAGRVAILLYAEILFCGRRRRRKDGAKRGPVQHPLLSFRCAAAAARRWSPSTRRQRLQISAVEQKPLLLVEDEPAMAREIEKELESLGYLVKVAANEETGLEAARSAEPALMIVDRMLAGTDSLSMIAILREEGIRAPVLFVSGLATVDERIRGLKAGGDDYLTKPFAMGELAARVEALLRRASNEATVLRVGPLELDLITRVARRGGRVLDLLPTEVKLLEYLMRRPARPSPGPCCSRMSGIIAICRRPTWSTSTSASCGARWMDRASRR